jgi:transposase-like protein
MSGWRLLQDRGRLLGMMTSPNPYRGFRFPPEVNQRAVWLHHCFGLSLCDVELILAARRIVVSYEASASGACASAGSPNAEAASATTWRQVVHERGVHPHPGDHTSYRLYTMS